MGRQRLTEKASRESFTLNSDNERDKTIKSYLLLQNNKAEFIKNVLYEYIKNNGIKNGAIIDTKIDTQIKNGAKIDTKNDIKIDNNVKNGAKNNTKIDTNNFKIEIDDTDNEIVEVKKDFEEEEIQSFNNALKGLGI